MKYLSACILLLIATATMSFGQNVGIFDNWIYNEQSIKFDYINFGICIGVDSDNNLIIDSEMRMNPMNISPTVSVKGLIVTIRFIDIDYENNFLQYKITTSVERKKLPDGSFVDVFNAINTHPNSKETAIINLNLKEVQILTNDNISIYIGNYDTF